MNVKPANKHELRTQETRALLLTAAETIFVRDGYEGAKLGEIAALAGRTKEAIYAQFKSKEDVFLALVEARTNCYAPDGNAPLSIHYHRRQSTSSTRLLPHHDGRSGLVAAAVGVQTSCHAASRVEEKAEKLLRKCPRNSHSGHPITNARVPHPEPA